MPYTFFDHTADVGIRAEGESLEALFTAMAQGLVELIAEGSALADKQARSLELSSTDAEGMLFKWLNELLFLFSTERFLPKEYGWRRLSTTELVVDLKGDAFDPRRHEQGREVKAITRHGLSVRQASGQWQAEVIVDV